jgi:hypothetical protein
MYESFREKIKSFVVEENRARKYRNFLLGTWDDLKGKEWGNDSGYNKKA